jgi:hypothetical protein
MRPGEHQRSVDPSIVKFVIDDVKKDCLYRRWPGILFESPKRRLHDQLLLRGHQ